MSWPSSTYTKHTSRLAQSLVIPNGTSVSASIDLDGSALIGFGLIATQTWTTAALTIEVSSNNTDWLTAVNDATGLTAGSYPSITPGTGYAVDALTFLPWRYARLRSGTSASPVNQGADRTFTVVTRPLA